MASSEEVEAEKPVTQEEGEEKTLLGVLIADDSYKGKMSMVQGEMILALVFVNVSMMGALLAIPGEKVGAVVYSALAFIIICILLQFAIGVIIGVLAYKPIATELDECHFHMLNSALIGLAAVLIGFAVLAMAMYIAVVFAEMPATVILENGDEDLPFCT